MLKKNSFFAVIVTIWAGMSSMLSGVAEASTYTCAAQMTWQSSMLWNGSYQVAVRPTMNGEAVGQVRLTRNYHGANPRVEMIQLRCVAGSNGAEFDCIENDVVARRPELLAGQFFVNGWARLYATPADEWQPYAIGDINCSRW
jgi:hypothetical protein